MNLEVGTLWSIGSALVTIGASWAFAKHAIKEQAEKIKRLEISDEKIREEFLTRKEYDLRMQTYDLRLQHLNDDVKSTHANTLTILNILTTRSVRTKRKEAADEPAE